MFALERREPINKSIRARGVARVSYSSEQLRPSWTIVLRHSEMPFDYFNGENNVSERYDRTHR